MDQFNSSTKKPIIVLFNLLTNNQEKPLGCKDKATNIKIKNEDFKNETSHRSKGLNLLGNLSFLPESGRKRKQNCMEVNQPEKQIKIEETNNNSNNEEEKVFNYMTGVYESVGKKLIESPKNKDKTQTESSEIKEELAHTEIDIHHPDQSHISHLQGSSTPLFNKSLFTLLTNINSSVHQKESLVLGNAKDNLISSLNHSQETPIKTLQKSIDISPDKEKYFNHRNNSVNLSSEHLKLDDSFETLPDNGEQSHNSINFIHSTPEQLNLDATANILPEKGEHFNHNLNSVHSPPEHLNLKATSNILPDNGEYSNHSINSVHLPPEHLNLEATPNISPDNEEHSNHSITSVTLPPEHLNLDDTSEILSDNGKNSQVNSNLDDIPDILSDNGEYSNHSNISVSLPPEALSVHDTSEILHDNEEHSNHFITSVTLPPEHLNLEDTSEIVSDNGEHSQVNSNLEDIPDILSDNGEYSNHSNNSASLSPEELSVHDTLDILPDTEEHSNHSITSVNLLPEHLNLDNTTKENVLRDLLSNKITKESYLTSGKPFKGLQSMSEINLSDNNENSNDSIVFDDLPSENSSSAHCSTSGANITLKDSTSYINESDTINIEVTILNKDKDLPELRQHLVQDPSANNLKKQQFLTKWRCKTCGLDAGTKEKLISHLYNEHLKEDYEIKIKCKSCTFESSTPEEMKVHKLTHEKNDEVRNKVATTVVGTSKNNTLLNYGFTLNCDRCKFQCDITEEMAKHRLGHETTGQSEHSALINRNLKVKCNLCKFECDTVKELELHILSHDKTPCSNITNSIISIRDSENENNDDDNHDDDDIYYRTSQQFKCFICNNYQTDNSMNMKFHAGTKHNVEYNCDDHFWKTPLKTCPKCIFENIKKDADASMLICKGCGYKTVRSTHFNRHKEKKSNCQTYKKKQKAFKSSVVAGSGNSEKLLGNALLNIFQCCDCPVAFTRKDDLKIHAMSNHLDSTYKCPLHKSKVNFIKCKKCIYELIFKKCDPKNSYEDRPVSKRIHLARKATEINKSAYHEPQEYTFTDSDSDPCEENETEVAVTRSRAAENKPNTNQTVIARSLGIKSNNSSSNSQTEKVIARSLGNQSNSSSRNTLLIVTVINTVPKLNHLKDNANIASGLTTTDNANIARGLPSDPDEVIVIDDSDEIICKNNPKKPPAIENRKRKDNDNNRREKEMSAQCFDCKYSSADRDHSFLVHVCRHIGSKYQCVKHSKRKLNDCLKCFYEETLKNVRHNCKLCQKCGFAAADSLSLKTHQGLTDSCKEWIDQKLKSGEIKCFGCGYITTHKKFLKYHMVDHLSIIFSCDVHPNVQNESCNKCINRSCLDDAKKEAKICKKCNFKTVIQQVFERHICKKTVDHSFANVLEQNNFQQVIIVDENEENIPVDKTCDQLQKYSGKQIVAENSVDKVILDNITMENTNSTIEVTNKKTHIEFSETNKTDKTVLTDVNKANITQTPVVGNIMVEEIRTGDENEKNIPVNKTCDQSQKYSGKQIVAENSVDKVILDNITMENTNSTIEVTNKNTHIELSETNNTDKTVLTDVNTAIITQTPVVGNIMVEEIRTEDEGTIEGSMTDVFAKMNSETVKENNPFGKIVLQSVKVYDPSATISDPSVKQNDQSLKPNDQSVKINDQSLKINDPSVDINERSVKQNYPSEKTNDQSVNINEPPVGTNYPSVKPSDQSVKITDPSVKPNDQSVKINDQLVKINDPAININDPSVDINNPSMKPNDQSSKINDPSLDINDTSIKSNEQPVKINDQSVKIHDPSVKINGPSVKINDQPVQINDQIKMNDSSIKTNDQYVKINDQSAKIHVLSVKINGPSVKINNQSAKKYSCFDCDLFVTNSIDDLKEHATSQHKSSIFKCNEHSSESDLNNCLKCIYEYTFLSQRKTPDHETESMDSEITRMSTLVNGQHAKNTKIDHSQSNGPDHSIVNKELKAKCYDCKFTVKNKGFRFKEHVSQHVGSKYQCLEHWKNKNCDCLKCYYEETLQTLNIEVKNCRYCGYRAMDTRGLKTHLSNPGTCTRWANRKLEAGHIRCFKCFFVTSKKQYLKYHMIDHLEWIFSCDLHREKKNEGCEKCTNMECLEMAKKEAKICKKCNFKTVIKQVFNMHECIAESGGYKGGCSGTTLSLTPVFSIKVLPVSFVSSESVVKTSQQDKTLNPPVIAKENLSFGSTQITNMDVPIINNTIDLPEVDSNVKQNTSVLQKTTYRCCDCDFSHNVKKYLISHVRVGHANSNFKCDEHEKSGAENCDKCFYWQILQDIPRCYDCCPPKAFSERSSVRKHISRLHKNSDFKCEEHKISCAESCGKCSYWQVLQGAKLPPVNRCYDCRPPKTFCDGWSLKRHIKYVHKDSVYVCDKHNEQNLECGHCYYQLKVNKKSVIKKTVIKKGKYRCFDCNFSHNKKSFLSGHAFTHKNSDFKCDKHDTFSTENCNKCFYWRVLQRIPILKRCYDCRPPQAFDDTWNLRRHARIHKNSVYVCKTHNGLNDMRCGKCFYQLIKEACGPDII